MRVLLAVVVVVLLVAGAAFLIVSRDGGGEGEPGPAPDTATGGQAGGRDPAAAGAGALPGEGRAPAETAGGTGAAAPAAAGDRESLLSLIEGSDLDAAQKATLRDALEEVADRPELLERLARRLRDELGE